MNHRIAAPTNRMLPIIRPSPMEISTGSDQKPLNVGQKQEIAPLTANEMATVRFKL